MLDARAECEEYRTSSRINRGIIARFWGNREVLGRLLGEISDDDLVRFGCEDAHRKYSLEGRVLFRWGDRMTLREKRMQPDGIVVWREGNIELVPYGVIVGYEMLTLKPRKVFMGGNY